MGWMSGVGLVHGLDDWCGDSPHLSLLTCKTKHLQHLLWPFWNCTTCSAYLWPAACIPDWLEWAPCVVLTCMQCWSGSRHQAGGNKLAPRAAVTYGMGPWTTGAGATCDFCPRAIMSGWPSMHCMQHVGNLKTQGQHGRLDDGALQTRSSPWAMSLTRLV